MPATVLTRPAADRFPARRRGRALPRQRLLMPMLHEPPAEPAGLPALKLIERQGPMLRPNPLSDIVNAEVDGLNLMAACASRCVFCFARAYPGQSASDASALYKDTASQLELELKRRRNKPRAVYLCPSSDPFPPYREVQEEACRVVETLADAGIEAWIMTRGFIRPFALERLARQRQHVRVTVPLTTLDRALQRQLEPLTASPRLRLKQVHALRDHGLRVAVSIEPLLPGLTDTRANLEPLLDEIAKLEVKRLTVSYAFVRRGIREHLQAELPDDVAAPLLAEYDGGPILSLAGLAPAQHLSRRERQRGYALLMTLAAQRGLSVSVSALTNPDFSPAPRRPTLEASRRERQLVEWE